ncbi:hypothetical protein C8J57DRAFT_1291352 [Mycena rebaudengoi]|nr:hypothetical protein C8J57DRAFT_1291352 [Mycena rebaudengoi]
MSFLLRLFRGEKPPDDYETILATLAANIQKRQTLLSEIRLRERKATTLVTLYAIVAWLAYLAVWYFGFVAAPSGAHGRVRGVERALRALPVFIGPILILFIRRIVQIWYNRKGNAEEKTLQTLLKEQRSKVEEIKKKTNFYSTRDLLSRYDGSAPSSPQPQTPQKGRQSMGGAQALQKPNAPSPLAAPAPPPQPQVPAQRKWYDALADVLVGAEDSGPASQKYALICEKCFTHNGLVPEIAYPDAQYKCPKCGHFNASARSKAGRGALVSPTSPTSPTSPMPMPQRAPSSTARADTGADVRRRSVRPVSGGSEGEERMEVDSE